MDAFGRGTICALRAAGAKRTDIAKRVRKKDGKRPSLRAVDAVLAKHKVDPSWRGDDSRAGGRPLVLSQKQRQQLLELVVAERGKAKVAVPCCRRRLRFLREVGKDIPLACNRVAAICKGIAGTYESPRRSHIAKLSAKHRKTLARRRRTREIPVRR